MSVIRILCYGDSNTYGFDAEDGSRFSQGVRWPTVMATALGEEAHVIEEGYNGRTIFDVSPFDDMLNGTAYLPGCINRYNPLDVIILYLGINDLFLSRQFTVKRIAEGLMSLVSICQERSKNRTGDSADVLIIAPPPVNAATAYRDYYASEIESSMQFAQEYERVAQTYKCLFLDAGSAIQAVELDGVHIDALNHKKLGIFVAEFLKEKLMH
jgi:lysophospholipase L1-like esterase